MQHNYYYTNNTNPSGAIPGGAIPLCSNHPVVRHPDWIVHLRFGAHRDAQLSRRRVLLQNVVIGGYNWPLGVSHCISLLAKHKETKYRYIHQAVLCAM